MSKSERLPDLVPGRITAVLQSLWDRVWEERKALGVEISPAVQGAPPFSQVEGQAYRELRPHSAYGDPGDPWLYYWFRLSLPEGEGTEGRYLLWDCDGEATVYHKGIPWSGLDVAHRYTRLPEDSSDSIFVEVGSYQTAIWIPGSEIGEGTPCRFRSATLAYRNEEIWELYWDLSVLSELLDHRLKEEGLVPSFREEPVQPYSRSRVFTRILLSRLDDMCDRVERGELEASRRILRELYTGYPASPAEGELRICGHAHLDMAWLWPEEATYHKGAHTFASMLRLMEDYPEFRFLHSSPFLFRKLEKRHPELMSEVRERIEEGRFEHTGALELESDVQLSSGEGLVRALRFGQKGFSALNGRHSPLAWLPDVFGYPQSLPQILRLGGADSLFTAKLYWSKQTRFPYTLFRWKGIDGSSVVVYNSPLGYDRDAPVEDLTRAVELNTESGCGVPSLLAAGYGDGGGGVTPETIERVSRLKNMHGVPHCSWSSSEELFDSYRESAAQLPEYDGELYLEFHRGTYTSQKRSKQLLRQLEEAVLLWEALLAYSGGSPASYDSWERLLFGQFHDVVPGSSIGRVYERLNRELKKSYDNRMEECAKLLSSSVSGDRRGLFYPALQAGLRLLPAEKQTGEHAVPILCPGPGFFCEDPGFVPSVPGVKIEQSSLGFRLDNSLIALELDTGGNVKGLYDLSGEQPLLLSGFAGFRLLSDYPASFDAWELDQSLGARSWNYRPLHAEIGVKEPYRASLDLELSNEEGHRLRVRYLLHAGEAYIRCRVQCDWQTRHRLLRFSLKPVFYPDRGCFGSPFGSIERPLRKGNRRALSMWEVPGNRWAAFLPRRGNGGLALLSEASYGFSAHDGLCSISLLRAPSWPDPDADRGEHTICFAFGAHREQRKMNVVSLPLPNTAAAADLLYQENLSAGAEEGRGLFSEGPLVESGGESLSAGSLSASEDGGTLLRFYEAFGCSGSVTLALPRLSKKPKAVDFLEREIDNVQIKELENGRYCIEYSPFTIFTLRILP